MLPPDNIKSQFLHSAFLNGFNVRIEGAPPFMDDTYVVHFFDQPEIGRTSRTYSPFCGNE